MPFRFTASATPYIGVNGAGRRALSIEHMCDVSRCLSETASRRNDRCLSLRLDAVGFARDLRLDLHRLAAVAAPDESVSCDSDVHEGESAVWARECGN